MKPEAPSPGLVFGSFLFRKDLFSHDHFKKFWQDKIGKSRYLFPTQNPLNRYYSKEMGDERSLSRVFCLSESVYPRESLLKLKLESLEWEKHWAQNEQRMVNVDIGLLSLENFILATTKNFTHRIFIGENIFAELTYCFTQGKWQMLPWTYPDYRDDEKINFFTEGRSFLLKALAR